MQRITSCEITHLSGPPTASRNDQLSCCHDERINDGAVRDNGFEETEAGLAANKHGKEVKQLPLSHPR